MTQSLPPDLRSRLPPHLSRFLGYRSGPPPYDPLPLPPFTYLHHIPIIVEIWLFAFIGSFGSILLIESIMITPTEFRDWGAPFIITSFGASAVLVFGVIESPLAQPINLVGGQMIAAVIGVGLTKLFMLGNEEEYEKSLDGQGLYPGSFVNGGLSMALALLAQQVLGLTHPPGGPTALAAALETPYIALGWRYLPLILVSSLLMLAWALIINNLGRRRYPVYWYKAEGIIPLFSERLRRRQEKRMEERRKMREVGGREAEEGGVDMLR